LHSSDESIRDGPEKAFWIFFCAGLVPCVVSPGFITPAFGGSSFAGKPIPAEAVSAIS
jgi:hypothetical protein